MNAKPTKYSTIRWILLSQLLLVIYLGFFHYSLNRTPTETFIAGVVCSITATVVVILGRNFFLTRLEYLAHFVIGLDIFLEGFFPHQGLGFYYCAVSFWTVFYCYHAFLLYRQKPDDIEAEIASSSQVESLG